MFSFFFLFITQILNALWVKLAVFIDKIFFFKFFYFDYVNDQHLPGKPLANFLVFSYFFLFFNFFFSISYFNFFYFAKFHLKLFLFYFDYFSPFFSNSLSLFRKKNFFKGIYTKISYFSSTITEDDTAVFKKKELNSPIFRKSRKALPANLYDFFNKTYILKYKSLCINYFFFPRLFNRSGQNLPDFYLYFFNYKGGISR